MAFDKKHPPKNDIIFSIMFENATLFKELLKAFTGKDAEIEKVHSQASIIPENVSESSIRFDTYATDKNGSIYSIDMQTSYIENRIKNRMLYYCCKAIAKQKVHRSKYELLHNVCVSFVITPKEKKANGVEKITVTNDRNELFSDLLTMYIAYIPTIVATDKEGGLKIFADFFSILSEEEMTNFQTKYKGNNLANHLIMAYNKAIGRNDLAIIERSEYFMWKFSEEDYAKEKAEGRAEGRAEFVQMLVKNGKSLKEIADFCSMSEDEVNAILKAIPC